MSVEPDFKLLFEKTPGARLVLTPELDIVAASDAYLRATKTRRAEIVGQHLFDVFPDNPDDPATTAVANTRASLGRVVAQRQADVMPVQKHDIRRPAEEGGGFEERYWSPVNSPVIRDDGELVYLLHSVEDVTELVRHQRAAHEQGEAARVFALRSEARYRQLLEAAPDAMVVVDALGRVSFANRRTEKLFGYAPDELVGQSIEVLIPPHVRARHAEHIRAFVASPIVRDMGSGLELFGQRRDGTQIPVEVSLSPLEVDGAKTVCAVIRDITERKRLEQNAKIAADRLVSAVENAQDAFALFDANYQLVLCNSAYRNLFGGSLTGPFVGRSYEELVDAGLETLAFADDRERELYRSARLAQRYDLQTVVDVKTRSGRSLRVMDRRTPEGGIVKTIWDLTDDVEREHQLKQARLVADSANTAKSEFLASMSHELRTPLNAILGFAQLLQRDKKEPLSERHQARVAQIISGGNHLLHLMNDILDLSIIEAAGVSMSLEPVALTDLLAEVVQTLEPAAARASVRIEETLTTDAPVLRADRTRLSQILLNFGSNAIKYNRPSGSVRFRVVRLNATTARVTVADSGMGIPPEQQAGVFQPFHRAGQEAGPIEGTGIGLAISKRLAELMDGSVGFRSIPNEGSEFWLDLPIHPERPASAPPAPSEKPHEHTGPRVHGRVLYIEDNPANVRFMRDLVGMLDEVELITTPTAEMGVDLARANPPNVIIMDINLPGMSGLDALRVLKGWPETRHIPVIALTAAASEKDRARGVRQGFSRYMTKPVDVAELEATLEALLHGGSVK